ncbi:MAG: ImmA/IrrE family metallo-endopeptidase [Deltaproteobacteria bacterium]|nr:ImmA/IrrE family metallo-endopeptidase [Deltaproteobacteria bacterium]
MKVPWLSRNAIADKASDLLLGYETMTGEKIHPPVPVEKIIEKYLGIRLGHVNFENRLGMKGVLGATYVKAKLILIDETLAQREKTGRACFTCAHETGHWVLHRQYVQEAQRTEGKEVIICREVDSKQPIEWQADYFAGCLLMPEKPLREAFNAVCGADVLYMENIRSTVKSSAVLIESCVENWPMIAEATMEAGRFENVSKQAMIIRLQDLGLLVNLTSEKLGWRKNSRN